MRKMAKGAAITGGVGVGLFPDFNVADKFIQVAEGARPSPAAAAAYAKSLAAKYGLRPEKKSKFRRALELAAE